MMTIYDWPTFRRETELDRDFADWAEAAYVELKPVREALMRPLPDDPRLLDEEVTHHIDGWLPRVAFLSVISEYYLARAKLEKLPPKRMGATGRPINTDIERTAEQTDLLADYRLVRDDLEITVQRMRDRVSWAQSVRKVQSDAQGMF